MLYLDLLQYFLDHEWKVDFKRVNGGCQVIMSHSNHYVLITSDTVFDLFARIKEIKGKQ